MDSKAKYRKSFGVGTGPTCSYEEFLEAELELFKGKWAISTALEKHVSEQLTQVKSELEIRKTNNLQEMENHHKMYLKAKELNQSLTQVRRERDETLTLINNPEINNFIEGVKSEAAHQIKRWGSEHDEGKTAEDWLWLLAYLSTKASQASRYGDNEKYLHHIVTCAAACFNWHKKVSTPEPQPKETDS